MAKDFSFKNKSDIVSALLWRGSRQQELFRQARRLRDKIFGASVEVRSVVEYSNICRQECNYCGMNRRSKVERFILARAKVLGRIAQLYTSGRRIFMFQSGEMGSSEHFKGLVSLLTELKQDYPDIILMCGLGSQGLGRYKELRDIGVERYLLKFETSDPFLYRQAKPRDTLADRLRHIRALKQLGFQVSSGNIIGLPGQSLTSLAEDLLLIRDLDLPMSCCSIFIPNDLSSYAHQQSGDINLALNFTAILRALCPKMLIPATSCLELVRRRGQFLGLLAGANTITLHDATPKNDEDKYVIYRSQRYKPTAALLKAAQDAGLKPVQSSIMPTKPEDSLFFKLVNKNISKDKTAIFSEGRKFSYAKLLALTSRCCSFLEGQGIKTGQVVLISLFDSLDFSVVFLSCLRLGVIAVLADPLLEPEDWQEVISQVKPDFILATEYACGRIKHINKIMVSSDESSQSFLSLIEACPESKTYACPDRNNPALVLLTSGSTGRPKAVLHTYKDLFVDVFPREILSAGSRDIFFSCSRMHTSYGLGNSLLHPFHSGSAVILSRGIPNHYSLEKILRLKPTLFFAVPGMYDYLLTHAGSLKGKLSSVRMFICAGEKLYADTFLGWQKAFGKKLVEHYGSSEMCHPIISNRPGNERANSFGRLLPGFQAKLNGQGMLLYRGPSLFCAYLGEEPLRRKKLAKGFFLSDDIACQDKAGYFYFQGRSNLVFKSDGKWVSAQDIESGLRRLSFVKEAAVLRGNRGLDYFVSLRSARLNRSEIEKKIRRYCLARFKPHEFGARINILDGLPHLASGKINRRKLEESFIKRS